MSIWAILLVVLLIVALTGTGYGYYGYPAGRASYANPLGLLAVVLLAIILLMMLTGSFFTVPVVP